MPFYTLLQAFENLVDCVGSPPAALPAPVSPLPPVDLTLPGIKDAEVGVPTWQDMGFTDPPTKVFKVCSMVKQKKYLVLCALV